MRKTGQYADEPLLLPIDIDPEPIEERLTAWGGAALLIQAIRSLDVPGSSKRNMQLKQRQRGYSEAEYVESLIVLHALGGDCVDDLERLREDAGLAELLGYEVPSPEAARKFLNQFHDEALVSEAQQQALALGQASSIPGENAALRGLAQVNGDVIGIIGRRCAEQKIATVDVDSTIIESWKREAQRTYEGSTGYQPSAGAMGGDGLGGGRRVSRRQRAGDSRPARCDPAGLRGLAAERERILFSW